MSFACAMRASLPDQPASGLHLSPAHISSSRPEPQVCMMSDTDPPAQYSMQIHSASRVRQLPCTWTGSEGGACS